jgi:hypothetical protein
MDKGFAKQLTERERVHHADHYHNYRHVKGPKGLTDDEVGGRESMRKRFNFGYDRKHFNENLNPLKSWIHSGLGKNWNKYYGELRKTFDARKVINAHILEHLFQYVEIHTHVGEKGAVMFMDTRYTNKGEQPISKCYKDYYVCPKSGVLRKTHKEPRRSVIKQKEADKLKEQLAIRRVIDAGNELHLIDGVWFHLTVKSVPLSTVVYLRPLGVTEFKVGHALLGRGQIVKAWNELNETERKQFGRPAYSQEGVRDVITGKLLHWTGPKRYSRSRAAYDKVAPRYFATKATASHKLLKQAGLA